VTAPDTATPVARIGNLSSHPELRFGKTGTAFARVGLAHRPHVPKGEPEAETVFYEVVAFGTLAEHVARSLQKGDRVVVVGKGEVEHWKDRDGVERSTKKIVADGIGPDLRFAAVEVQRVERRAPTPVEEEPF